MTRIILFAAPNTLSAQLAAMQKLGLVPSGPPIIPDDMIRDILSGDYLGELPRWDSRATDYPDYLAVKK